MPQLHLPKGISPIIAFMYDPSFHWRDNGPTWFGTLGEMMGRGFAFQGPSQKLFYLWSQLALMPMGSISTHHGPHSGQHRLPGRALYRGANTLAGEASKISTPTSPQSSTVLVFLFFLSFSTLSDLLSSPLTPSVNPDPDSFFSYLFYRHLSWRCLIMVRDIQLPGDITGRETLN